MTAQIGRAYRIRLGVSLGVLTCAVLLSSRSAIEAGLVGSRSSVGGVIINAEGVLDQAQVQERKELRDLRTKLLAENDPGDLKKFTKLRKVSLRKLEAAIAKHRQNAVVPLPVDIKLLAGLQQIKYVFVYPDENDIVLVGPAEGWKLDNDGEIVGLTTNRPVMRLDDLMAALRTGGRDGIQCSIDPTPEGLKRLQTLVGKLKTIGNPKATFTAIEEALGPQVISVGGVANTTHFARVMVAADYRMKRLAMNFEEAPVAGLPSFLDMTKASGRGMKNMLPRWWLAPKAEPLLISPDGLSFELRGLGVKCMTEEDVVAADGQRNQTGKAGLVAQKWADTFTDKYDEVSTKIAIFGQLRNLMDMAVVAALAERHNMFERAGFKAPYLMQEEMLNEMNPPRRVASRASFLKKGRNWLISASGGVQIHPSEIAAKTEKSESLAPMRGQMASSSDRWWWD